MFWKVLLSCLSIRAVHSEKDFWRRGLITSWCELYPASLGYSRGSHFLCRRENDVAETVGRLKGVTLNVGIIEGGDFEYDCSSDVENGVLKPKDSYGLYLLTILQEVLQFQVKFLSSTTWGYHGESNDSWKGLTGMLAYNRTDLTACHWSASEILTNVGEYLFATLETSEAFVFVPQNLPLTEDVFVEAFSRKLWVFFLLSISLLVVSFWFSTYMHSRVRPDHEPWNWDEVLLWAVAAISQQSFSRHPRGSSCRTMFLIGYLIAYLFYTGFAAGITSLLALQSHRNRLTLSDVAAMKLHLLLHRDEFYRDFFQMPGPHMAHLDVEAGEGESLKQIFEKIHQPKFVGFGAEVTFLHYLRMEEDRGRHRYYAIAAVPNSIRRKAFLVRRSFPHRHLFDYWLLRLRENGMLDYGRQRYLKTEETAHLPATVWFSAGLSNVFSAFVFLFSGWLLSVFVLFGEILSKKNTKTKSTTSEKRHS